MPTAKKPAAKKAAPKKPPEPSAVEEYAVEVKPDGVVLSINGADFALDPHRLLNLSQALSGATAGYVY